MCVCVCVCVFVSFKIRYRPPYSHIFVFPILSTYKKEGSINW